LHLHDAGIKRQNTNALQDLFFFFLFLQDLFSTRKTESFKTRDGYILPALQKPNPSPEEYHTDQWNGFDPRERKAHEDRADWLKAAISCGVAAASMQAIFFF